MKDTEKESIIPIDEIGNLLKVENDDDDINGNNS